MYAGTIETPLKERWELQALKPCDVAGWRHRVRDELDERGYESDDAVVVVTELLSNLVAHVVEDDDPASGDGALWIEVRGTVEGQERELFIGVSDRSSKKPVVSPPDWERERGRGMVLVEKLAISWDMIPTRTGKLVYALLPLRRAEGDDKDSGWGLTP